jgi:hypothetical protein
MQPFPLLETGGNAATSSPYREANSQTRRLQALIFGAALRIKSKIFLRASPRDVLLPPAAPASFARALWMSSFETAPPAPPPAAAPTTTYVDAASEGGLQPVGAAGAVAGNLRQKFWKQFSDKKASLVAAFVNFIHTCTNKAKEAFADDDYGKVNLVEGIVMVVSPKGDVDVFYSNLFDSGMYQLHTIPL